MVIDDLADRAHACDVLLDQNYFMDPKQRYFGRVPDTCQLLLGPRFALLHPAYRTYREGREPRDGTVRRVLVFFGGADPQDMSGLTLETLSQHEFRHLRVDLVCGRDRPRRAELERQAAGRPGTAVHGPRPHLADLMASADVSIGAGGSTTWERMCLGVRSLVITVAANQEPLARSLADEGLITLIGRSTDVAVADVGRALSDEIHCRSRRDSVARGMALCDGLGTPRVADVLIRGLARATASAGRTSMELG